MAVSGENRSPASVRLYAGQSPAGDVDGLTWAAEGAASAAAARRGRADWCARILFMVTSGRGLLSPTYGPAGARSKHP
jgi:hypothetical protein